MKPRQTSLFDSSGLRRSPYFANLGQYAWGVIWMIADEDAILDEQIEPDTLGMLIHRRIARVGSDGMVELTKEAKDELNV